MWRSQGSFWESVVPFLHAGARCGSRHCYLLNYLAGPAMSSLPVFDSGFGQLVDIVCFPGVI